MYKPHYILEKLLPKCGCGLSTETLFKLFEFEGLVEKLRLRVMLYDRQSRKPRLKPYKTISNSKENLI